MDEQLKIYICDSTKSISARNTAINIAEVCDVKAVQEYLPNIALDPDQPSLLRISAVAAVCQIGDNTIKARLIPLALSIPQNDLEENLKGYGLQAVWPDHITHITEKERVTVENIFSTLTQPISNIIGGIYQEFIAKDLAEYLDISDLPFALRWLEEQIPRRGLLYPFAQLSDAIMLKAWEYLEEPDVFQGFVSVTYLRLKNHDKIIEGDNLYNTVSFSQLMQGDDQKRRQIIKKIISIITESEQEPSWLIEYGLYGTKTILEEDFLWLIESCNISSSERIQKIYAKLINKLITLKLNRQYLGNEDTLLGKQVDALLIAIQNNSILRAELNLWIETIELGTPKAEGIRAEYQYQDMLESEKTKPLLELSPKEKVIAALEVFESGQIDTWCSLCYKMTLKADSETYEDIDALISLTNLPGWIETEDSTSEIHRYIYALTSLTNLPGWIEAEDSTKKRILQAANQYIIYGDPRNAYCLGTNNEDLIYAHIILSYLTLCLLLREAPDFLASLSSEEWQKWTGVVLSCPNREGMENQQYRQELVRRAYQNAPTKFIKVLMMLIDKDNREYGSIRITRLITNCWDEHLAKEIFSKVKDTTLTSQSFKCLLEDLLKYKEDSEVIAFAESLITLPPPKSNGERKRAIAATCALIVNTKNAGWSVIWPAIQQDPEFGREILESVSGLFEYNGSLEERIKEEYVADLYIFIFKQYPDNEHKKQKNSKNEMLSGIEPFTAVTPEMKMKTWRDYIPQRLQERGTPQACEALRKIIRELPELKDKLQWRLLEAETLTRRHTWEGLKPEQIFQIVSQKELQTPQIILILSSDPDNMRRLRISKEVREIEQSLRLSKNQVQYKLEQRWAVRTSDFRQALLDFKPKIVHFSGHGSGEEGLIVEDENGQSKSLSKEALVDLLQKCAEYIKCVILNACYSEVQAKEIANYIDYVIGMSGDIMDKAAIEFAKGFYNALGAGESIEIAYGIGCNAIKLEGISGDLIPKLIKKKI